MTFRVTGPEYGEFELQVHHNHNKWNYSMRADRIGHIICLDVRSPRFYYSLPIPYIGVMESGTKSAISPTKTRLSVPNIQPVCDDYHI